MTRPSVPVHMQERGKNPTLSSDSYDCTESTVVIVPTFNERDNIEELCVRFFAHVRNATLLVVDDASPDGTAEKCRALQERFSDLQLLLRDGPRGLGRAYLAGIDWALARDFRIIGTMDADLSHDPAHLPRMLSALDRADLVIGSRYVRDGGTINWQIRRILLSWMANTFAAQLMRVPAADLTSGFRLYRREVLETIAIHETKSTGYSFLVELVYRAHRAGARVAESPIIFFDRTMGESKLRKREIYMGAFNLLRLKLTKIPRRND